MDELTSYVDFMPTILELCGIHKVRPRDTTFCINTDEFYINPMNFALIMISCLCSQAAATPLSRTIAGTVPAPDELCHRILTMICCIDSCRRLCSRIM